MRHFYQDDNGVLLHIFQLYVYAHTFVCIPLIFEARKLVLLEVLCLLKVCIKSSLRKVVTYVFNHDIYLCLKSIKLCIKLSDNPK